MALAHESGRGNQADGKPKEAPGLNKAAPRTITVRSQNNHDRWRHKTTPSEQTARPWHLATRPAFRRPWPASDRESVRMPRSHHSIDFSHSRTRSGTWTHVTRFGSCMSRGQSKQSTQSTYSFDGCCSAGSPRQWGFLPRAGRPGTPARPQSRNTETRNLQGCARSYRTANTDHALGDRGCEVWGSWSDVPSRSSAWPRKLVGAAWL